MHPSSAFSTRNGKVDKSLFKLTAAQQEPMLDGKAKLRQTRPLLLTEVIFVAAKEVRG